MNKVELIAQVSKESDMPRQDIGKAIESFMQVISKALVNGESVVLVGFGTFKVTHRKARMGRNPKTGETINIPEKKTPRFSPGKALSEAIAS